MAIDLDRGSTPAQRCPQCKQLGLIFDDERRAFRCSRCGYTQALRTQA